MWCSARFEQGSCPPGSPRRPCMPMPVELDIPEQPTDRHIKRMASSCIKGREGGLQDSAKGGNMYELRGLGDQAGCRSVRRLTCRAVTTPVWFRDGVRQMIFSHAAVCHRAPGRACVPSATLLRPDGKT